MTNSYKRGSWKELSVLFAVLIPSFITILNTQFLFELSFKLLNQEELLLLIQNKDSTLTVVLGVFLFYGALIGLFLFKKTRNRKISLCVFIAGIIIILLSLQSYTVLTPSHVISKKISKPSHIYVKYSEIDNIEIEADMHFVNNGKTMSYKCQPYFTIKGIQKPFKIIFTAEVSSINRQPVYEAINIFKEKNISIQHVLYNNCLNDTLQQFEEFETEFKRHLAN